MLFSAPGRTELGGNHTDHQKGCVVAASICKKISAEAEQTADNRIIIRSSDCGAEDIEIRLDEEGTWKAPVAGEKGTSVALVRAVAAEIARMGYKVGGFTAVTTSNIPIGAGLSSSAAFEILIGRIINGLYCENALSQVQLAVIGQKAENLYFGKPSGLMDQLACASDGIIAVDFEVPKEPKVRQIDVDFAELGYGICLINSGGSHADLTEDYASITEDMKSVASFFGCEVLREVDVEDFYEQGEEVRKACGGKAFYRAKHFFEENLRAEEMGDVLERIAYLRQAGVPMQDEQIKGMFGYFLKLVRDSGNSSEKQLQNVVSAVHPEEHLLQDTIDMARDILEELGAESGSAVRVHGGGFAGTAQAVVPLELKEEFESRVEARLGKGKCLWVR